MSLKLEFTCNQCKKLYVNAMPGWLELSQPQKAGDRSSLKLNKTHHFCCIKCLAEWSAAASIVAVKMWQNVKDLPGPHGSYISREPGMEDISL